MKARRALLVALLVGVVFGCVSEDRANRVLHAAGYSDVKLGGYAWLSCAEDDKTKRKFTAKGPTGEHVDGAVCCGAFGKSCTIRLD